MPKIWIDAEDFFDAYGEPCNNCEFYIKGAYCGKNHRQKIVGLLTSHIPELTARRKGGCNSHILDESLENWWHEDPIRTYSSVYGGTKTNLLV